MLLYFILVVRQWIGYIEGDLNYTKEKIIQRGSKKHKQMFT